jgi:hypothetical protein
MGYGKSVAWLDTTGHKAVILANSYTYSTYQWISSSVHVYDVESDGFSDSTQPIYVYPNGQQVLLQVMDPTFLRLSCSPAGNLGLLDRLGNGVGILAAPPSTYPNTNISVYSTSPIPCNRGTGRNYSGIELCSPYSASSNCSKDLFCPYGAVGEVPYSEFQSIEQNQDYPESPENVVFDDILMQNMFTLNLNSIHCLLVSPITWVVLVVIIGFTVAIIMTISEAFCPHHQSRRHCVKQIFRKMDLIGEGEVFYQCSFVIFIENVFLFRCGPVV